jgi:V/A-type H+-transporting ATPase subunit E
MSGAPHEKATAPVNSADAAEPAANESAGVEELIGRLRDSGVARGRTEAEGIIASARQEAAEIVAAARREGDGIVTQARTEGAKLKTATEDALRLASRDTILSMESSLLERFQRMVRWLVKDTLDDPGFLQRLILEVAGRAAPPDGVLRVLLPEKLVSLEDLLKDPEEAKPGTLMGFVRSAGGKLLREGVTFGSSADVEDGIRVEIVGADVHLELTENAIGTLLLQHMLPRFRALLRGAVVVDPAAPAVRDEPKKGAVAR